ncbi:MAG: hypothetical protein V2A58_03925 [Planctomycetota bacterium]
MSPLTLNSMKGPLRKANVVLSGALLIALVVLWVVAPEGGLFVLPLGLVRGMGIFLSGWYIAIVYIGGTDPDRTGLRKVMWALFYIVLWLLILCGLAFAIAMGLASNWGSGFTGR